MKLKRSLKNKLKKFLFVLPILSLVFSLICLPVSADTGSTNQYFGNTTYISMPISQPSVSDNFAYIEVILQDSRTGSYSAGVYLISAFSPNVSTDLPSIQTIVGNFTNNRQSITFVPKSSSSYDYRVFFVNSVGSYWDLGIADTSSNVVDTHNYNSVVAIRYYGFAIDDGNTIVNSSASTLFNVAYGTDYLHSALLTAILDNMPGTDYIIDSITDNADENTQALSGTISTENQINRKNDDDNAQAIQDNADENTDKILNGWENDVEVESGDTGSLEDSEKDFIANNQQAADEEVSAATDNIFSSVRRLSSSFGAVGTMFRQLTVRVPDFNVFIYFSLVIGIVPLIVGMTVNGLRASDRASARQRQEAAYKRGYNSGYTRGKGG